MMAGLIIRLFLLLVSALNSGGPTSLSHAPDDTTTEPELRPLPVGILYGSFYLVTDSTMRTRRILIRINESDSLVRGVWPAFGILTGTSTAEHTNLKLVRHDFGDTIDIVGKCYRLHGQAHHVHENGFEYDSVWDWTIFSGTMYGPMSDYPLGIIRLDRENKHPTYINRHRR